MEECLKEAYAEGITVIPVGHHNLQRLSRVYVEECVIENCDEVLELFERYLTPVYFSGHLHTQKVMKHLTEPGMDSDTYGIWEIVSNSLILPPCQYGTVTLNTDGSIDYLAKIVNVSSWAAANGETDENLLDFSSYTENYLQTVLKNQIARKLEDVPKELREVMVDFIRICIKTTMPVCRSATRRRKMSSATDSGSAIWIPALSSASSTE